MYGFYCIAFMKHMFTGKTSVDYTSLISPNGYERNEKIQYDYYRYKYITSQV